MLAEAPRRTARQCARSISTNAIHQRRNIRADRLRQLQRRRNESRPSVTKAKAGASLQVLAGMQGSRRRRTKEFCRERRRDPRAPRENSPPARSVSNAGSTAGKIVCALTANEGDAELRGRLPGGDRAGNRRAATLFGSAPLFVKEARVDDLTGPSAVRRRVDVHDRPVGQLRRLDRNC
mgnify:CR=1 FL=1